MAGLPSPAPRPLLHQGFAGWAVGLNISNRDKRRILLAACDAWGLRWGEDLAIDLPNA